MLVLKNIKITSLPSTGELLYNNLSVSVNQVISKEELDALKLKYVSVQQTSSAYNTSFNFSISDTGSQQYATGGLVNIAVSDYVNQPPTIGDGEISVDEGEIYTFRRSDFTTDTDPPYSDPENDPALYLKILTLPSDGDLKHNGAIISSMDYIVSFEDIDNGLLTFVQDPNKGGRSPYFLFAIQDTGSGEFVE